MLFQSFDFLLFFPLVAGIYFLLPVRFRWIWILAASYAFYMFWNPWYILLLITSTLTDYIVALSIEKSDTKNKKKRWLAFSLIINLGMLCVFKYFNFFSEQFGWVIKHFDPDYTPFLLSVLLPVGISFYTFQTLGYTLDVYHGREKPVSHLGTFAIYVSFFPQLVAGPIERARNLLPQLHFNYKFDTIRVTEGLRLFLWGLFKKLVIADRIGTYVNEVFGDPMAHSGSVSLMASYLFFFQIYYDFSAYQDMAVGTARILGIKLSKNFEPLALLATSFKKFWRGWHITLTTWIKDYVYAPLTFSDTSRPKFSLSPVYMFFIVGLWHGANWTYIAWGLLQGIFIVIERMLQPLSLYLQQRIGKFVVQVLGFILFFNAFTFANIFFRSPSITDGFKMLSQIIKFPGTDLNPGLFPLEFNILFLTLGASVIFEFLRRHKPSYDFLNFRAGWMRWVTYILMGLAIWFLRIPEDVQFIYFEF